MSKIIILLIRFYQYFISPLLGNNCRFHPTCSEYAKEAITLHGSLKGLWFAFKRIIKCQPFYNGGYDAVPTNKYVVAQISNSSLRATKRSVAIQKNNKKLLILAFLTGLLRQLLRISVAQTKKYEPCNDHHNKSK